MPRSYYLYIVGIAFAAGIFYGSFYDVPIAAIVWLALLTLVIAVWGRINTTHFTSYLLISLVGFCFAAGLFRMEWAHQSEINPMWEDKIGEDIETEGMIVREPEDREHSAHLYVETADGLLLVTTPLGSDWKYGDRVRVSGELKKPESFETDLGRTFNYPGYLLARGVSYTIRSAEVQKIEEGNGFLLFEKIFELKQAFMSRLEQLIPEPQVGLGEGLLLGVKGALGEDLEKTFRKTGIIHIVVLSGYNVMIVVAFILYILGSVFGHRLSTWFGIVAIVLFAILVGLSATVIRASIMAALLLLIALTGRLYDALRGLILAGIVMLIWNPHLLVFDPGFQLSFLATLGLIFVSPHLTERLQLVPNRWISAREFLVATLSTQLFVLPILLYQIGEFSVVAVIVNVLVLPMVPLAMLLTFATGMLSIISVSLAAPFAFLTHVTLSYIIFMAEWFGSLSFAAFNVPPFPFLFVPVGYTLIGVLIFTLNKRITAPQENAAHTQTS